MIVVPAISPDRVIRTPRQIMRTVVGNVAKEHMVPPEEIFSGVRDPRINKARMAAILEIKRLYPRMKAAQIGSFFSMTDEGITYHLRKFRSQKIKIAK